MIVGPGTADEESQQLADALALSLSLAPIETTTRAKAPPTPCPVLPPVESRRSPPDAPPRLIHRLPVLFPPVGHEWNTSALGRDSRPAPARAPSRFRELFGKFRLGVFDTFHLVIDAICSTADERRCPGRYVLSRPLLKSIRMTMCVWMPLLRCPRP